MLHRDIFWIGRQWCVTGFGIQMIDSKLEMRFDIPVSKVLDQELIGRLLPEPWFDAADFVEALAVARIRLENNPTGSAAPLTDER